MASKDQVYIDFIGADEEGRDEAQRKSAEKAAEQIATHRGPFFMILIDELDDEGIGEMTTVVGNVVKVKESWSKDRREAEILRNTLGLCLMAREGLSNYLKTVLRKNMGLIKSLVREREMESERNLIRMIFGEETEIIFADDLLNKMADDDPTGGKGI